MTMNTLEQDIKNSVSALLEMASVSCWNDISENCVYIISEIKDVENIKLERIERNKINEQKTPYSYEEMIADLKNIYRIIYDINLYVYKSEKDRTIIDVRYYPNTNFDDDFLEKVKDKTPMIHCKINNPPYISTFDDAYDRQEKFDVNWELGGIRHQWKMFWYGRKMKKRLR